MTKEPNSTGTRQEKHYGALSLTSKCPKQWLKGQRQIVGRIILAIEDQAKLEREHEKVAGDFYRKELKYRRPSQVHLIDGPRGSGKTSALLTIEQFLNHLCDGEKVGRPETIAEILENASRTPNNPEPCSGSGDPCRTKTDWSGSIGFGSDPRKVATTLRVIVPEEMETSESVLEGLLSQMHQHLRELQSSDAGRRTASNPEIDAALKDLKDVAKGWYLAREHGVQALLSDSVNFDAYINHRTEQASFIHGRIERWRSFVVRYLDIMQAQLLVVLIDDSDATPQLSEQILDVLRVMLDHPRIVSVLAGNLSSMRHSYVTRAFARMTDTFEVLPESSRLRSEWLDHVRIQNEEFFEKVLPRHTRHYISPKDEDFFNIFGETFVQMAEKQIRPFVSSFINLKAKSVDSRYRENKEEDDQMENVVGWWLLLVRYQERLVPKVIRHLNFFNYQIGDPPEPGAGQVAPSMMSRRRLPVVLFFSPENFSLIQRFGDADNDVANWLRRQDIRADWRGTRSIRLNTLELFEASYSYHMLLYRLDLQIGLPYRNDRDTDFPKTLLPKPSGNALWVREVWDNRATSNDLPEQATFLKTTGVIQDAGEFNVLQELYGVERALFSPVIPANCVYFKDLSALPDLAFEPSDPDDISSALWPEFPASEARGIFGLTRADHRMPYFQDVVLNIASFPLRPPLPTDEFVRHSGLPLRTLELSAGEEKLGEMFAPTETKPGDKDVPAVVTSLHSNFFRLIRDVISQQIRAALSKREDKRWRGPVEVVSLFTPTALKDAARDMSGSPDNLVSYRFDAFIAGVIPRYHRILNDTRRAWHAIRIYEAEIAGLLQMDRLTDANGPESGQNPSTGSSIVEDDGYRLHQRLRTLRHDRTDKYQVIGIKELEEALLWKDFDSGAGNGDTEPVHPIDKVLNVLKSKKASTPEITIFAAIEAAAKEDWVNDPSLLTEDPAFTKRALYFDHNTTGLSLEDKKDNLTANFALDCTAKKAFGDMEQAEWLDGTQWKGGRGPSSKEVKPRQIDWQLLARLFVDWPLGDLGADRDGKPEVQLKKMKCLAITRQMRAELMALWGLGPSLCSLIHIDLMGHYYNYSTAPNEDQKSEALENIISLTRRWHRFLMRAQWFAATMGHTIEWIAIDNARLFNLEDDDPGSEWAKGLGKPLTAVFPDQSLKTLGVRFSPKGDKEEIDPFKNEPFSGAIGDVIMRCSLAEKYLLDLARDLQKQLTEDDPNKSQG